ncbi:MAG: type II toxin-antitoxin system HicB family antitoxin [Bacteroidales bacterium]|nr:type II toxin-antitoxin system HicB family antitoxin [Bacteroidales bacterium]
MNRKHTKNLKYKGYCGSVEYNREKKYFHGKVLGMTKDLILYEGDTMDELKTDFQGAIENYFDTCQEMGIKPRKPYGILSIRIPSDLHCKVSRYAENNDVSINAAIRNAIEKQYGNYAY